MTKRNLPQLPAFQNRDGIEFEVPMQALQRWNNTIRAQEDAATISIYDYIGSDGYGGGITAGRIAGALRAIGEKDVVVNINSPGGSVFEGIAIYNLLRQHPKNVTVRVVGLAASAASVIAMAGDTIQMGRAAFMMIHNVLWVAIGNRHAMRDAADVMEPIDNALAELYAARTGMKAADIADLMDKETWLGGDAAVDQGFADELMPEDAVTKNEEPKRNAAQARMEIQGALTKAGYSRGRQRELLKEFSGTPSAAANTATPSAGDEGPQITPCAEPAAPVAATTQLDDKESNMDINELKLKHPELFNSVRAEGLAAGIAQERQRIQDVEAQALPGHADLINTLKFDGKTSGDQAAAQILAAERSKLGKKASDILADAASVPAAAATPSADGQQPAQPAAEDKSKPLTERCKAKWDADANVRAEFVDFDNYVAYMKAEESGNVRVLGATKK